MITELMDTWYLVNVVHNDFKEPDAIFEPFWKAGEEYAATKPRVNGIAAEAEAAPTAANGETTIPLVSS